MTISDTHTYRFLRRKAKDHCTPRHSTAQSLECGGNLTPRSTRRREAFELLPARMLLVWKGSLGLRIIFLCSLIALLSQSQRLHRTVRGFPRKSNPTPHSSRNTWPFRHGPPGTHLQMSSHASKQSRLSSMDCHYCPAFFYSQPHPLSNTPCETTNGFQHPLHVLLSPPSRDSFAALAGS